MPKKRAHVPKKEKKIGGNAETERGLRKRGEEKGVWGQGNDAGKPAPLSFAQGQTLIGKWSEHNAKTWKKVALVANATHQVKGGRRHEDPAEEAKWMSLWWQQRQRETTKSWKEWFRKTAVVQTRVRENRRERKETHQSKARKGEKTLNTREDGGACSDEDEEEKKLSG